ncbi:MAG: choice-of-anchor K domain-containing protein [Pseudomonadota bacterium]
MRTLQTVSASIALAMAASNAFAAAVTIESVTGEWVSVGPNNVFGVEYSASRDQVDWGRPFRSGGDKSGYKFEGLIPPPINVTPDTTFDLGKFTHLNNSLSPNTPGAPTISQAELKVDIGVDIGGSKYSISQTYNFAHEETANRIGTRATCAYGGAEGQGVNVNGCADRVTATLNDAVSETIVLDGLEYIFEITGFMAEGAMNLLDFFLTTEEEDNSAILVGKYSINEVDDPTPPAPPETPPETPPSSPPGDPITPVPLPAAGWMLIAGIGGLAALRRRKKA